MQSLMIQCDICPATEAIKTDGHGPCFPGFHAPAVRLRLSGRRAVPRARRARFPDIAPVHTLEALARAIRPGLEEEVLQAYSEDLDEAREALDRHADADPYGGLSPITVEAGELDLCPACVARPEAIALLVERLSVRESMLASPPYVG